MQPPTYLQQRVLLGPVSWQIFRTPGQFTLSLKKVTEKDAIPLCDAESNHPGLHLTEILCRAVILTAGACIT